MSHSEQFAALLRDHMRRLDWSASKLARALNVNRSTTNRWLNGEKLPDPAIIQRLADVLGLHHRARRQFLLSWAGTVDSGSASDDPGDPIPKPDPDLQIDPQAPIPPVAPLPAGSRVPFRRNPLFVGRNPTLQQLAAALQPAEATVALSGIGGIGKTQLAVEFAHRYGALFRGGVFWLNMAEARTVPLEVAACGGLGAMELRADFYTLPLADHVRLVQAAWNMATPRLLIFDNCEDEALLAAWRPVTGGSRVVLTTRRGRWSVALGVKVLALESLHRAESIALLTQFVQNNEAPARSIPTAHLDALAATVGDLPLALHLVGSYLGRNVPPRAVRRYLTELRAGLFSHPALQDGDFSPTDHLKHLEQTLDMSYRRLQTANDGAAQALFARAAHFAPGESIPQAILIASLAGAGYEQPAIRAGLEHLLELGLLEEPVEQTYRMHHLLAAFARRRGAEQEAEAAVAQSLVREANRLLEAGLPEPLRALQPHLYHVADQRDDTFAADLWVALGWHLVQICDYAAAQSALERALELRRRINGAEHPETAGVINVIGLFHQSQSDFDTAITHFRHALTIWQNSLGPEDQTSVLGYGNLGYAQMVQGDYAAAHSNISRALELNIRYYGEEHPRTARLIGYLGYLLLQQGTYSAAQPYLEQSLALRLQLLGEDHPATAQSLNNLGDLHLAMHNYAAARVYHERALALRLALFGNEHIDTAESRFKIAQLAEAAGDTAGAQAHYQDVLRLREQLVGPNHIEVAWAAEALGRLLVRLGRPTAARPHLERAMAIYQLLLHPQHPDRLRLQQSLADLGKNM